MHPPLDAEAVLLARRLADVREGRDPELVQDLVIGQDRSLRALQAALTQRCGALGLGRPDVLPAGPHEPL